MHENIIESDTPMIDGYENDELLVPTHKDADEQAPDLSEAQKVLAQLGRLDMSITDIPDVEVIAAVQDGNADRIDAESSATVLEELTPAIYDAPEQNNDNPDQPCDNSIQPSIYVVQGKIGEVIDAVEELLAISGRFFQRGGQIVEVRPDEDGSGYAIKAMSIDSLQVALASMSQWWRQESRSGKWNPCDPISKVCRLVINGSRFKHLKPLKGIVNQPHLRPDGSLCLSPGYDTATGLFGVFDAQAIKVDPEPNLESARAAVGELEGLLSEVGFASDRDKSATLAAILTAAVRPSLPNAPMFLVTAHQPGSGKSYLCDLIALFAGPKPSSKASFPVSNEECGKLLLSQLMRAPAVVEFDNVTTDIKTFDKLCTALTSEHIEGRVLGTSATVGVGTRALFLGSGNNVKPVGDMLRRTMVIHLDPKLETPSTRKFARPHLLEDVRRERTRYVTAALTVVRAWLTSGTTTAPCRPLGSFGEWSRWCRESLIWLGFEDPAAGLFDGLESDPEKLLMGRVLAGWNARYGSSSVMVRRVVPDAMLPKADEDFREALIEASGCTDSINVRKLGHWLSRHEGRVVNGLRLIKARKTSSAQSWGVESVVA